MTTCPTFHYLLIPSVIGSAANIPFEMQPIVQVADGRIRACELLYRGMKPMDWTIIDVAMINYLSQARIGLPPVFVNLSNNVLMSRAASEFANAATANDVTFELSEDLSGYVDRAAIALKVNELINVGARVALDDFGAGRDGLERLYAIRNVAAVKIDREFLLTCMHRQDARRMLSMLVAQWRVEGIQSIAEGVETAEMFAFAQKLNVDLVQGWFVDTLVDRTRSGPY